MNTGALFEQLRKFDTPTICNALEVVRGKRFTNGFTRQRLIAAFPKLPPIVGFARTVMIRCSEPFDPVLRKQKLLGYYEYVAQPNNHPLPLCRISTTAGLGAFWASQHHGALGIGLRRRTNGSM